jgi:ABC-type uncharacterized transport system involved in gliding motility auxiliary subunit
LNQENGRRMKNWVINVLVTINALLYLVIIGMWISIPEEHILNIISTGVSLVFTAILIWFNKKRFYHFYTSHFFKKLTTSLVSIFLVIVILGFINFLAFKNAILWDVTKNQVHSLTEETAGVLKSITSPIKIKVFSLKKDYEVIRALLELYRLRNNEVEIDFVDAQLKPQLVKEVGITKVPALEIEVAGKKKLIEELSELSITNALTLLSRKIDPTIYFITGHGEINLDSEANEGGSELKKLLLAKTLSLKTLNLRESQAIPDDARVLVFWGSKEGFFDHEIELIKKFIQNGGKVMFGIDPDFNGSGALKLKQMLADFGLEVRNDLIIDRIKHANGSQGTVPVIHQYDPNHPITKDFKGTVFLPLASSVADISLQNGGKPKWDLLGISNSFPASWGENNRDELVSLKVTFTEGEDHKGPLGYFAVYENKVENPTGEDRDAKMVVFGNSTFIINSYKKFPQNFILFLNSLNWLVGEERLIAFNVTGIEDRPIFMSENQIGVIFFFTVIFCPLFLVIIAFVLYKRRQKL